MGYTHYWKLGQKPTPAQWKRFTTAVSKIVELSNVQVQFEYDEASPPQIDDERVRFNGVDEDGHETFFIEPEDVEFNFCKTAHKDYDEIVVACLIAAANILPGFSWRSDGDAEEHVRGRALAGRIELPYKTEYSR